MNTDLNSSKALNPPTSYVHPVIILGNVLSEILGRQRRSSSKVRHSNNNTPVIGMLTFVFFRHRTSYTRAKQALDCEEISSRIFRGRYIKDDEESKREKELCCMESEFVFVGAFLQFHDREMNSVSDGDDRSTIVVKVYEKHITRKDVLVGSFAGTIGSVLEHLKDGGMNSFVLISAES
jgi:hypothetical protein